MGVLEFRDEDFPVRDGVKLKGDVFRPRSREKFPAILMQTPYGKSGQAGRR